MNARLFLVITLCIILASCEDEPTHPIEKKPQDTTQQKPDTLDCPEPEHDDRGDWFSPLYGADRPRLSHEGKKLAYRINEGAIHVLDLQSLQDRTLDIRAMTQAPGFSLIAVGTVLWCPYDSDRLLVHTAGFTDTAGDGNFAYGQHIFIVSLLKNSAQNVTPSAFGKAGGDFLLYSWLVSTNILQDSIFLLYDLPNDGGFRQGIYVPQLQTITNTNFPEVRSFQQSKAGINYFGVSSASPFIGDTYLNGKLLTLPSESINYMSWSPNAKKIALSVMPKGDPAKLRFEKIWVLDADKFLKENVINIDTIDLQKRFCMYSFGGGISAEFITDSTLAVSMHKDKSVSSNLWEITLDGRMKRKLTELPE